MTATRRTIEVEIAVDLTEFHRALRRLDPVRYRDPVEDFEDCLAGLHAMFTSTRADIDRMRAALDVIAATPQEDPHDRR